MAEQKFSELDFEQILENMKTFLRSQSQLQDYDFDGSALSVLIDLLAYNTHINAYYAQQAINESFITTAQLRENVILKEKEL